MTTETSTQTAKQYEALKLIINLSESVFTFLILLVFVWNGSSLHLRDWVQSLTENAYVQFLIYSAILGGGLSLITLPFSFYSGYYLEHRFHLSNQSLAAWIWDKVKTLLVGLVLGVPLLLVFYYLLLHYPKTWWLWLSFILFFFSVFIGKITPQIILPLFYKFTPIDDPVLKSYMENLARKGKFQLQGVYRFNMSKETKKANAAFTGIGKSRRIIIGDTLLENYSPQEIEAVFAHEVGHYVHKHVYKLMIWGSLEMFLGLYLANLIYTYFLGLMHLASPADLAALPLMVLILTLYSAIITPLSNTLSRYFERQADRYALENTSDPAALVRALQKLSEQNLTDKDPHPLIEFLFHAHPSVKSRIAKAQTYIRDRNGVEATNKSAEIKRA